MEGKNAANIPTIMTKYNDISFRISGNQYISDALQEHKKTLHIEWTDEEKAIFTRSFVDNPKKFSVIAENLPNKTTAQCVQYYYLSKKKINYKSMVKLRRINSPLEKKTLPKRKAAIEAKKKLRDHISLEGADPPSKRQCMPSTEKDNELNKVTEIWIIADDVPYRDINNNYLEVYQEDVLSVHNFQPIEVNPFNLHKSVILKAKTKKEKIDRVYVHASGDGFDPDSCINRHRITSKKNAPDRKFL